MRSAFRLLFLLLFAVFMVSCSSDDETSTAEDTTIGESEEQTTDSEDTAPASEDAAPADEDTAPASEDTAPADVDYSQYYFDGTTRESLPADDDERFDLMYDWIDFNLESNAGYSYGSANGVTSLEFSVNMADPDEAATQCEVYRDLAAAYRFDDVDELVIAGWILGDDGSFSAADWEPIPCDL